MTAALTALPGPQSFWIRSNARMRCLRWQIQVEEFGVLMVTVGALEDC